MKHPEIAEIAKLLSEDRRASGAGSAALKVSSHLSHGSFRPTFQAEALFISWAGKANFSPAIDLWRLVFDNHSGL